jgi:phage shock protein C
MADEERKETKRLYRSRADRILGGVCGGLAEYLEVDPTVVRLLWVFSFFVFGFGLLLYIVALIIVPNNPHQAVPDKLARSEERARTPRRKTEWNLAVGVVLLLLGSILLLGQFDILDFHWLRFRFFPWRLFWPLALIGVGVFLIASGATVSQVVNGVREKASESRLRKSRQEKMLFGVCAGIGRYFRLDPTVVRILWVVVTIFSGGIFLIVYLVLALILPFDDELERAEADESRDNAGGSTS